MKELRRLFLVQDLIDSLKVQLIFKQFAFSASENIIESKLQFFSTSLQF